jgi:hypothetical protein
MKPQREHATNNAQTYMVASSTWERRSLFQVDAWAKLLVDTLYHYRNTTSDYSVHVSYVRNSPMKDGFCERPDKYPYSSAYPGFELDAIPQGLKPQLVWRSDGAAEAAPFQNKTASRTTASGTTASGAARLQVGPEVRRF